MKEPSRAADEGAEALPPIAWRAPTGPPRGPVTGPPPGPESRAAAPGWYEDPLGRFQSRWWNGERWTEHGHGLPQMPAPTPAARAWTPQRAAPRFDPAPGWVLVGGAAAIAVGSLLPWASVTGPFVGTVQVNGTNGDGVITLVLGVVVALLGFPLVKAATSRARVIAALVIALIAGVVCLADIVNIERLVNEAEEQSSLVTGDVGFGLWLAGAGALSASGGALAALLGGRGRGQPGSGGPDDPSSRVPRAPEP